MHIVTHIYNYVRMYNIYMYMYIYVYVFRVYNMYTRVIIVQCVMRRDP